MRGKDPGAGGDVEGMTTDLTFQRAVEDSGELAAPIFSLPPPFLRGLLSLRVGRGGDAAGFTLKEHVGRSCPGSTLGSCNGNRNLVIVSAFSIGETGRFCQSLQCSKDVNMLPNRKSTRTQGSWESTYEYFFTAQFERVLFSTPSRLLNQ